MSNEDYQAELKQRDRLSRLGGIPPANGTQMMSGFSVFSVFLIVASCVVIAIGIFFFVINSRNQTNNYGNFTKGDKGDKGDQGPRGVQGEKGDKGEPGDQGDQGVPGEQGPPGMCSNTNPFCQKGDPGIQGPPGLNGTQGPIGLTGDRGLPGPEGAPGRDGINGTNGVDGRNGTDGAQGDPGVCDCLNLTYANFATVNVSSQLYIPTNSTFLLEGTLDCQGLGSIGSSCLDALSCATNFSTCDLEANSLLIKNWGLDNSLYFSKTNVTFTQRFPYASLFVYFGDYTSLNNRLSYFGVYATTTEIIASGNLNLKTTAGPILIQAPFGSANFDIFITSLAGSVIVTSADTMTFTNNQGVIAFTAGNAGMTMANIGQITTTAQQFVSIQTPLFTASYFDGTTHTWFSTNVNHSYMCPLLNLTALAPLEQDPSKDMTQIGPNADFILGDNVTFGSTASDGLVPVYGGFTLYCNRIIRGFNGGMVTITAAITETLNIPGRITNAATSTSPLQISDPQGLDLQSTPIFNSEGGGVNFTDTTGVYITNGQNVNTSTSFLAVNQITSVRPTTDTLFITAPTVFVTGAIHATGNISSDSSCCTSDIRVKQNLRPVLPKEDLETVLAFPRRVSFQYTDDYKATNSYLSRNLTYNGFVAQEMEQAGFHTMVNKAWYPVELKKSGTVINELMSLDMVQAIPHLIGAVQALYEEQIKMKELIRKQGKLIKKLQKKKINKTS